MKRIKLLKKQKNKDSNRWLDRHLNDEYVIKSKIDGFRSRSSYKLIELNNRFRFIKKNSNLLDLGSSPGGWSQVASKIITSGKILSIDILPMEPLNKVDFLNSNIFESETQKKIISYNKINCNRRKKKR